MAESTQTYKSHRRYIPVFHFFAIPVLIVNVVVQLLRFSDDRTAYSGWLVLVAIALVILIFAARSMVSRVQDRVIRLEERMRLASLLPQDLQHRVNELTLSQLVGLRFASDDELPELARRCLDGDLVKGEQVKKEVKRWRPDNVRA